MACAIDVSIKHEPSYTSPYAHPSSQPSQSPTSKRQRSTEPEGSEKRLKTDHESIGNDDLAAIIAQATASATQQFAQSGQGGQGRNAAADMLAAGEESSGSAVSSGLLADPHLYMRILSLPILESLVCLCLLSGMGIWFNGDSRAKLTLRSLSRSSRL